MRNEVLELIAEAVKELNEELQYETLERVNDDTPLFGGDDGIDSLSLVRLVLDVEQRVDARFNKAISLADEKAMSARRSPYRSVGALADFVLDKIGA
jgi:acyl carrier protein